MKSPPVSDVVLIPDTRIGELDSENYQRALYILDRVEEMAKARNLESLGRSTMSEAVSLMDMNSTVVPLIIKRLKISRNYKFRFWLVDLLGYMRSPLGIIPLSEIIEDETEREKVRIRACLSIRELGYPKAIDTLLISRDIVRNNKVRIKIDEVIDYLR